MELNDPIMRVLGLVMWPPEAWAATMHENRCCPSTHMQKRDMHLTKSVNGGSGDAAAVILTECFELHIAWLAARSSQHLRYWVTSDLSSMEQ